MDEKHRLFLLDIVRVSCALLIFLRHSITMFGCSYGTILDSFICQMTSPVMTCFFILSGFSIHYQHRNEEISSNWTKCFLKKRLIAIMPSYLLVVILYPVVFWDHVKKWAILLPVDLFGVQTSYHTLFGIVHNGGTWFVSCLLLGYLLYPIIKSVLDSKAKWVAIAMAIIPHAILMYSILIIPVFQLEGLYSNPIARSAEFVIGVAFADTLYNQLAVKKTRVALIISLSTIVSVVVALISHADAKSCVFSFLVTPGILIILLVSSRIRSCQFENSKCLSVLSGMSYQFYLVQIFLWRLSTWIISIFFLEDENIIRIMVSLSMCMIIAFLIWRFYDRPIRKALKQRLL